MKRSEEDVAPVVHILEKVREVRFTWYGHVIRRNKGETLLYRI